MARKSKKKTIDTYCEFENVEFPCNVLAVVGSPNERK